MRGLERWLRKTPVTKQLAWTAGLVGLSVVVIPVFSIAGVIAVAPLWTQTWKALTLLREEQAPEDQEGPTS